MLTGHELFHDVEQRGQVRKFEVQESKCCFRKLRLISLRAGDEGESNFTELIVREKLYKPDKARPGPSMAPYVPTNPPTPVTPTTVISWDPDNFMAPCWVDSVPYAHESENKYCEYDVSFEFMDAVYSFVSSFARGNCSVSFGSSGDAITECSASQDIANQTCLTSARGEAEHCTDLWWLENFSHGGYASFDNISNVVQDLALAMTDSARDPLQGKVEYARGTAWGTVVCTEFDWPWLCFPAALVLLTAISLASVTSATTRKKHQSPL